MPGSPGIRPPRSRAMTSRRRNGWRRSCRAPPISAAADQGNAAWAEMTPGRSGSARRAHRSPSGRRPTPAATTASRPAAPGPRIPGAPDTRCAPGSSRVSGPRTARMSRCSPEYSASTDFPLTPVPQITSPRCAIRMMDPTVSNRTSPSWTGSPSPCAARMRCTIRGPSRSPKLFTRRRMRQPSRSRRRFPAAPWIPMNDCDGAHLSSTLAVVDVLRRRHDVVGALLQVRRRRCFLRGWTFRRPKSAAGQHQRDDADGRPKVPAKGRPAQADQREGDRHRQRRRR